MTVSPFHREHDGIYLRHATTRHAMRYPLERCLLNTTYLPKNRSSRITEPKGHRVCGVQNRIQADPTIPLQQRRCLRRGRGREEGTSCRVVMGVRPYLRPQIGLKGQTDGGPGDDNETMDTCRDISHSSRRRQWRGVLPPSPIHPSSRETDTTGKQADRQARRPPKRGGPSPPLGHPSSPVTSHCEVSPFASWLAVPLYPTADSHRPSPSPSRRR
ncbi:hypothetical protein QBC39DRAFT_30252 [Podospora conica]|nr:hypothetical protein QBC39DRAFT_30252 [Schizothecium conicum]